jgi:hypothetical protein
VAKPLSSPCSLRSSSSPYAPLSPSAPCAPRELAVPELHCIAPAPSASQLGRSSLLHIASGRARLRPLLVLLLLAHGSRFLYARAPCFPVQSSMVSSSLRALPSALPASCSPSSASSSYLPCRGTPLRAARRARPALGFHLPTCVPVRARRAPTASCARSCVYSFLALVPARVELSCRALAPSNRLLAVRAVEVSSPYALTSAAADSAIKFASAPCSARFAVGNFSTFQIRAACSVCARFSSIGFVRARVCRRAVEPVIFGSIPTSPGL